MCHISKLYYYIIEAICAIITAIGYFIGVNRIVAGILFIIWLINGIMIGIHIATDKYHTIVIDDIEDMDTDDEGNVVEFNDKRK